MSFRRWALVLLLASASAEATAQTHNTIWQAQVLGTRANSHFIGVGMGLGRRAGGRLSYQLSLTPGLVDRTFALRSEGILAFSLDPARRDGVSPYGGGGIAALFEAESADAFLVLLIGVESAPQAASGWFAEIGVGGGVRGSVGWRLRR